jgi:hypothetical protein
MAWAALVFASALDRGGMPAALLSSAAACEYIAGRADGACRSAGADVRHLVLDTYAHLERFGLLSVDRTSAGVTVWLHSAVRAAVRAYLAPGSVDRVARAVATALAKDGAAAGDEAFGADEVLRLALDDCSHYQGAGDPMTDVAGDSLRAATE